MGNYKLNMDQNQQYLSHLQEAQKYSVTQFDKTIMLLSTGALALSIGFINDIVLIKESDYRFFLFAGWVALIFSILSGMLSHYFSMRAINKVVQAVHEERDDIHDVHKRANKPTKWLNKISIFFVVLGISTIVLYTIINLYE